jgi:hypothetical protein
MTCIVPAQIIEKILNSAVAQEDRKTRAQKQTGVFR